MLAKMNVPANSEVTLMAATIGTARGDGKEEWDSDFDVTLHMSHARGNYCSEDGACRNDC